MSVSVKYIHNVIMYSATAGFLRGKRPAFSMGKKYQCWKTKYTKLYFPHGLLLTLTQ